MTISDNIFQILNEKGISQKVLSEKTGIPQSTISDWKHKEINPSADKILILCKALSVTPYELLDEDNKEDTDYLVSFGSEEHFILGEWRSLKRRQKDRLLGYIEALKKE